jgi:transcriptional regulator
MYQPPHFREDDLRVQQALIRAYPLGLLVSAGPSGLLANPVPFHLDAEATPKGTLRLHLARANRQWQDIRDGAEVLAVFQGADSYVTPSWYETKRETGKVVPTWNYAVVQARGTGRIVEDVDWLRRQIRALTGERENGRAMPWAVEDAPDSFIAAQIRGIVGIEIEIATIEGKWKVSQNRPLADRDGVERGLLAEDSASEMAKLVGRYGAKRSE